ncbi:hypothetical protein A2276_00835 [candidate division WOR-1 bacterium RIFOXYA12_FULL_43_27]|uniref:Uncharacterized protein n=1 Tax=candidate division WOR-1 bacterium RIFOXYC2_FULL_46_14 TaxID=1802587 RepID=A0A1F4U4S7_UNCSA|nr:MAG: hypothetical protein A2276_00835 [candidate division WOR-1 bacterium RIFOXYA12_FULL_43_27]OGC31494.1 MAG: hypothetical protein A2232_04410 [candidate division WOR-1 bacterium RIFOXYA2_FULL_46_56]OGC39901.1 MAG: hypothetical protein A2438_05250 [candidate division WOR-1 bacterium RIFOXYC2_FULL_46_14]
MLLVLLDNFVTMGLKSLFPTRHKITGRCKMCGNCCREIRMKIAPAFLSSKFFTELVIRWISWLFDFYLIEIDFEHQDLVFSCYHRGEDGKCKNYFWRPSICRNYPLLDYFKKPVFLPGCGYYAED